MSAKMFSLILATCGRMQEVDNFLRSITMQNCDMSVLEVIIVDQNGENGTDIAPIVSKYQEKIDIKHIKSDRRGLSLSRNIGLRLAGGKFVAFPDDDCLYYPDTLCETENAFNLNPDIEVFLGRIVDRVTCKNIIRNWKDAAFSIALPNFFLNYSAITIFSRKNSILFDETLGLGTYYGSYEDADYIVQALQSGKKIQYNPCIEVWHPEAQAGFHEQKLYSYGLGFGALCRKHLSFFFLWLFLKVIGYHTALMILSTITLDMRQAKRRFLSVKSRVQGFVSYKGRAL